MNSPLKDSSLPINNNLGKIILNPINIKTKK